MEHRRRYHPADFGDLQWARLLAFALERADGFECAIPYPYVVQDLAVAPLWPPELNAFQPDLVDRHVSLIRWELAHDYATQFVRFRITPALAGYVRAMRHLEYWSWQRGAPEDPTLYEGNAVVLATESVDGRIAVYADAADVAILNDHGIRLIEPLGLKAEPWPTP